MRERNNVHSLPPPRSRRPRPATRLPLPVAALCCALTWVAGIAGAAPIRIDPATIAALRSEGLQSNQVMDHLSWLADVYGPRTAGTPAMMQASDWAMKQMKDWGLSNVHREYFPEGEGWSLVRAEITMTKPQTMPIIGLPLAWTPGTAGPVEAEVLAPGLHSDNDFAAWHGKLRGKIVLLQSARPVSLLTQSPTYRYSDADLAALKSTPISKQWLAPQTDSTGAGKKPSGLLGRTAGPEAEWEDRLIAFLKAEGVMAVLGRGDDQTTERVGASENIPGLTQRIDGGTLFVDNARPGMNNEARLLPWLTIAVEQYNRMMRILDKGIPVKVALNVAVKWWPEQAPGSGFNTLAEIPGTDLKDEIVLIGAHLDGKSNATAATDDGAGCAAMMEAVRLLMRTGVKPRRTIRIGLWGGEELGMLGSTAYVRTHYGDWTTNTLNRDAGNVSVYFNLDNGSGRARGLWLQNNVAAEPLLQSWIQPLADLGVTTLARRGTTGRFSGNEFAGGTDHLAFDLLGIPAFQLIQDRLEYFNRTAHSNMDYLDHASQDDLIQLSVTMAVLVYEAAMADERVPHKVRVPRPSIAQ
jgi:carboxypeptidase Q